MKAVNSPAKPIAGIAQGVHIMLGTWSGKLDFSIVPMDDFDQVHAFPLPATNSLSIVDGTKACMVPNGTRQVRGEDTLRHAIQKGFQEGPKLLGLHSRTK